MKALKAAIVVPAYNEEASIAGVVNSLNSHGTVLVVDDGSRDETAARAGRAKAVIVSHDTNRGYDAAIASGFFRAEEMGFDAVVTFDADGQLDASVIPAMLSAIENDKAKLVLGCRDSGGVRISEKLFNAYVAMRFGVPDILCGLKVFLMRDALNHKAHMVHNRVNTALALALLRDGADYALVPVKVRPRAGESRFGGAWRANMRIFGALASALRDDFLSR